MGSGVLRGVAGFIVFLIAFFVGALVLEFLSLLANTVSHGWPPNWGRVVAAALGGGIGVGLGKITLDAVFKRYPAKAIAGAFIALNLIVIIGDLATWGSEVDREGTVVQLVCSAVAIAAAIYILWLGRGKALGRPAGSNP